MRLLALFVFLAIANPVAAASVGLQAVNDAQWTSPAKGKKAPSPTPFLIKAQVLLDRAGFSPGEIDGKSGDNFRKAVEAFAGSRGLSSKGELTEEIWRQLSETSSDPVAIEYVLVDQDVRGPFLHKLPSQLESMKDLPHLGYTSPEEKVAEAFHMSRELLRALNAGRWVETAGGKIVVVNVTANELRAKVARIEVDKTAKLMRAFDRDQALLAAFPVTVGSNDKPAPTGRLKVTGVTKNPSYRYNPKYAFKGVRTNRPFTIKPGPNNPVGVVWIGLSAEGYGIHGTPDPSKVGKSESHGCVRMTNWDVLRLASAVTAGTPVDFTGDEVDPTAQARARKR